MNSDIINPKLGQSDLVYDLYRSSIKLSCQLIVTAHGLHLHFLIYWCSAVVKIYFNALRIKPGFQPYAAQRTQRITWQIPAMSLATSCVSCVKLDSMFYFSCEACFGPCVACVRLETGLKVCCGRKSYKRMPHSCQLHNLYWPRTQVLNTCTLFFMKLSKIKQST